MKTTLTAFAIVFSLLLSVGSSEAGPKPKGKKFKPTKAKYVGVIREFDARDEIQIYLREGSTDFVEIQFADDIKCTGPDGRIVNHDRLEDAVDAGGVYIVEVYCRRWSGSYVVTRAIVTPAARR